MTLLLQKRKSAFFLLNDIGYFLDNDLINNSFECLKKGIQ